MAEQWSTTFRNRLPHADWQDWAILVLAAWLFIFAMGVSLPGKLICRECLQEKPRKYRSTPPPPPEYWQLFLLCWRFPACFGG